MPFWPVRSVNTSSNTFLHLSLNSPSSPSRCQSAPPDASCLAVKAGAFICVFTFTCSSCPTLFSSSALLKVRRRSEEGFTLPEERKKKRMMDVTEQSPSVLLETLVSPPGWTCVPSAAWQKWISLLGMCDSPAHIPPLRTVQPIDKVCHQLVRLFTSSSHGVTMSTFFFFLPL